jgi:hypothetical protein
MEITVDASVLAAGLGALGGVITTASLAWTKVVKPLRTTMERFRLFAEDWSGEPGRPGVAERPGMMVRMAAVEAEFKPNHGGSMRDSLNRLEASMASHLASHAVVLAAPSPPSLLSDGTHHSDNNSGGMP